MAAKTKTKAATTYSITWRNKFLCTDAATFDEFIACLDDAATQLKQMREAGVEMESEGIVDDYATFTTTDPKVAKRFGMEKE